MRRNSAPRRAAVVGAHRGADASAPGRAGPVGFGAVTEARFRAAEPLGVPARGVVPQVVVDVSCVAPIAPVGGRATVPSRTRVAIPDVKVLSFAAHASSLVARRSLLAGMRPLPEGRALRTREPAEHKRYLLETMFTGWSVLPLGYRPSYRPTYRPGYDRVTGWDCRPGLRSETPAGVTYRLASLASFTGWSVPAASGVRLARQCRERKR